MFMNNTTLTRTMFPQRVVPTDHRPLKPGAYNTKLGKVIQKGPWAGLPIWSLTLEERATCSRTCKVWETCYGNNMPWAKRHLPGPALEAAIEAQIEKLGGKIAVRLHILGDFYSVEYVGFWERMLTKFPELRIWGYTSWEPGTEIGDAIQTLRASNPNFALRVSGIDTEVVKDFADAKGIRCPEQTGRTASCGTCAVCWATDRVISFEEH